MTTPPPSHRSPRPVRGRGKHRRQQRRWSWSNAGRDSSKPWLEARPRTHLAQLQCSPQPQAASFVAANDVTGIARRAATRTMRSFEDITNSLGLSAPPRRDKGARRGDRSRDRARLNFSSSAANHQEITTQRRSFKPVRHAPKWGRLFERAERAAQAAREPIRGPRHRMRERREAATVDAPAALESRGWSASNTERSPRTKAVPEALDEALPPGQAPPRTPQEGPTPTHHALNR